MIRLALALLLSGCASFDRYQWEADPSSAKCADVAWHQVDASRIPGLCSDGRTAVHADACVMGCVVVSRFSEDEAKRVLCDGMSLYEHEVVMHAQRGLKHQ
jgi:hypothetical protein